MAAHIVLHKLKATINRLIFEDTSRSESMRSERSWGLITANSCSLPMEKDIEYFVSVSVPVLYLTSISWFHLNLTLSCLKIGEAAGHKLGI